MNIMIVDDEKLLRNGFRYMTNWEEKGITIVGEAMNGQDALNQIPLLNPDIVITDIKMPVMDGVTLTRYIKESYPHIAVIVLSSYDDYDYVRESMKLGASDYLLKAAIDVDELYDILCRLNLPPTLVSTEPAPPSEPLSSSEQLLTVANTTSNTELIESIIQYIENHYTENISLASIADAFYINKNYLCALFKAETETTINEYIASLRIENAKLLMRDKTLTLLQISMRIGYQNQTYFNRVFKRKTGFSPSEYSKLCR